MARAELVEATAMRLRSRDGDGDLHSHVVANRQWMGTARFVTILASCIAAVIAFAWLGISSRTATIAFADVQEQVQSLRSVQYLETRIMIENPATKVPPNAAVTTTDKQIRRRHLVLRHLKRTETLDFYGKIEHVSIYDANTGKQVFLEPKWKVFSIPVAQVTIDWNTNKTTKTMLGPPVPSPNADFCKEVCRIPAGATTRLPDTTIDGKRVVGFSYELKRQRRQGTDTMKGTYWVDPKTRLPVRVEASSRSTDPASGWSDSVLSDFVYDKEIPESLFITDPPAGYSVRKVNIHGIRR